MLVSAQFFNRLDALMVCPTVTLEEEASERFKEVTMRQHQQMRVPVVLEVATSHIRITSVCRNLVLEGIDIDGCCR
jgi:hypothetical protein